MSAAIANTVVEAGVLYEKAVREYAVECPSVVAAGACYHNGTSISRAGFSGDIVLNCKRFPDVGTDSRKRMRGVHLSQKLGPDGTRKEQLKWRDGKNIANRFHFAAALVANGQWEDIGVTVSHLCHNAECCNKEHLCMESLAVNKGRNGCMGGSCCGHSPACIRPGPNVLQ